MKDGYNPFELESDEAETKKPSGYSLDEFYIASTDKRGHYEQVSIKIPQGSLGHIRHIIDSFPAYRSIQDVFRDAIVHLMHHRNDQLKSQAVTEYLNLERHRSQIATIQRELEDRQNIIQTTLDALKLTSEVRDYATMAQVIDRAEIALDSLHGPHKETLTKELQRYRDELKREIDKDLDKYLSEIDDKRWD